LEAVAGHFSATWDAGRDTKEASLTLAGRRIAVVVTTPEGRGAGHGGVAALRLRFDKVATRLLERLSAPLGETVPDGTTVVLTVTAPIHKWAKTASSLEAKIRASLARGSSSRVEEDTIEGNRVHVRVLKDGSERGPKMIGFVHNPDTDALLLVKMARTLLGLRSARADRRPIRRTQDRWLVVVSGGVRSVLEVYRSICSQVGLDADFTKILVVLGDGHVEEIARTSARTVSR
ncbi:MAG: hypothetical protein ACAI25_18220, partial [Planctomycetota bacterium]